MGFTDIFGVWLNILILKKTPYEIKESNPNFMQGVKRLGFAGVLAGLVSGILAMLGLGAAANVPGMGGEMMAAIGGIALVASVIVTPIVLIVMSLIVTVIYFIFAKLLGGQGGFQSLFGVLATVQSAYSGLGNIITAVLGAILGMVAAGVGGMVTALVGLLLFISAVIQSVKTLKACFGFGTGKAVIVLLLPIVIIAVLLFLLAGAMFGAILSQMGGGVMMPTGP